MLILSVLSFDEAATQPLLSLGLMSRLLASALQSTTAMDTSDKLYAKQPEVKLHFLPRYASRPAFALKLVGSKGGLALQNARYTL